MVNLPRIVNILRNSEINDKMIFKKTNILIKVIFMFIKEFIVAPEKYYILRY